MRIAVASTLLAAALCFGPELTAAETIIRGHVTDPTGATVAHANVTLTARDTAFRQSTNTDSTGAFQFGSLAGGGYVLEARAPGLAAAEPKSIELETGRTTDIEVQLELARLATEVQVTASATAQTTAEQSKVIDVVDADQLDRRDVYSVAQAIQYLPGLRVEQLGGPGALVKVLSRGLPPYDTSLLIDGFRLRDAAAPQGDAQAYLGDLLIVNSDRVEVLRGTGSSLYGTSASAGVINVVTDNGGGQTRGDILAEGGGLGEIRGVARVAGGALADRLGYSAGLSYLNVIRGIGGNDRYRNWSGQAYSRYALTPSTVVSGRLFGATAYTQLNVSPYALDNLPSTAFIPAIAGVTFMPDQNDPDSSRKAYYVSGMVSLWQKLSNAASLRVSYQGVGTSRDNRDGPAGPGLFQPSTSTSSLFDGRLDTVQARTDVQLGKTNLITAGYEFEREHYHDHSIDQNPDPTQRINAGTDIGQRSNAIFAQDQIRLLDNRLQFSLSGRTQLFNVDRPEFRGGNAIYTNPSFGKPPSAYTGDGSVAYLLPGSGTKLRAHVGNGYRAPSLYERFGSSFFFGTFTPYGDPTLRPERLISVDSGVDQYLANQRVRIRATYFYTRIQESILFDFSGIINAETDPYGRFGGYRNTGGGLARGVETGVDTVLSRTTNLSATYTYTNSKERNSALYGGSLRSYRVFDHMFTLQATQRLGKKIDAAFSLLAASNYIFPFYVYPQGSVPFQFDGPLKADLSVNYTHPISDRLSLKFYTRVENLLNRTYYEEGFRTPKAWAVGGMKFIF